MLPLTGLDVLVVDCQTTGATPAHGVVLEIAWAVARAAPLEGAPAVRQLESHWITLPPGHRVPAPVRRLTGFDPAQVSETLAAADAWQRLRSALGAGPTLAGGPVPTAIHFAQFELGFLRDWALQYEPTAPFPLDVVCVHAIACRLFPELPRRSIRALAGFLGHSLELERRSRGHVEATAFIWNKLALELRERGVGSWQELQHWLSSPRPPRARKRRYPLPSASWRALPDEPGVYRFLRSNGDVLYVGKAASLRKRVASHFTAGVNTSERALEMLTQVHEIRATPTATALEAALLENEEIKAIDPPYNIQLLDGDRNTWFFDRNLDSSAASADESHRRGPVPSTYSVRAVRALRALASGQAPGASLRARAVGTIERWAPDEATFAEGYRRFAERHGLLGKSPAESAAQLLCVARQLLATGTEEAAASEEASPGRADAWDPERVLRHLERGLAHGHQLLQRARWLCLLHDSCVVFREASSERTRLLSIRAGSCIAASDAPSQSELQRLPFRPLAERQAAFDRARYDRLRTLTSELKRVLRDGGSARLQLGRRWLEAGALRDGLRWI
ncbi:MAG TPA: GIY-YIG nuclease family protein [Polyangiaceae bacterium]|nr:GIY-YIG nuclease family protein [Polyangiaceae bacterium]